MKLLTRAPHHRLPKFSTFFLNMVVFFIAEDFSSKLDIFEQGGLEPLITLLSSHDCDVQVSALFISCRFKCFQSQSQTRPSSIPSSLYLLPFSDSNVPKVKLTLVDSEYFLRTPDDVNIFIVPFECPSRIRKIIVFCF